MTSTTKTTAKKPTTDQKLKALEKRVAELEKQNDELRQLSNSIANEANANLGRIFISLGQVISRQGGAIVDSVYPPEYILTKVDGEKVEKTKQSLCLIVESDDNLSLMGQGEHSELIPIDPNSVGREQLEQFIKDEKIEAGKLVWFNYQRKVSE